MNLSSHPRNMLEFSTSNRKLGVRMNYQVFLIRIIDDVFQSLSKQVTEKQLINAVLNQAYKFSVV